MSNCKSIIEINAQKDVAKRATAHAKVIYDARLAREHHLEREHNRLHTEGFCDPVLVDELDGLGNPTGKKVWAHRAHCKCGCCLSNCADGKCGCTRTGGGS